MKRMLQHIREQQEGSIVLEASISVIFFLLFVIMMYGLIVVFMAQNLIGHALMESTQSLALDSYATTQIGERLAEDLTVGRGVREVIDAIFGKKPDDPNFSTRERWFDRDSGATQEDWPQAAKDRFVGYFAGGDKKRAGDMLTGMGVVGGLDGLDFSKSDLVGNDAYVRVEYKIAYIFNPFGIAEFETAQQACSRLWGAKVIDDEKPIVTAPGTGAPKFVN